MRKLIRLLLAAIPASVSLVSAAPDRPNNVLIISDDQGFDDYGFRGHPHIETPAPRQVAIPRFPRRNW